MLLNDCLIFGTFQPSVAYEGVAYKKKRVIHFIAVKEKLNYRSLSVRNLSSYYTRVRYIIILYTYRDNIKFTAYDENKNHVTGHGTTHVITSMYYERSYSPEQFRQIIRYSPEQFR